MWRRVSVFLTAFGGLLFYLLSTGSAFYENTASYARNAVRGYLDLEAKYRLKARARALRDQQTALNDKNAKLELSSRTRDRAGLDPREELSTALYLQNLRAMDFPIPPDLQRQREDEFRQSAKRQPLPDNHAEQAKLREIVKQETARLYWMELEWARLSSLNEWERDFRPLFSVASGASNPEARWDLSWRETYERLQEDAKTSALAKHWQEREYEVLAQVFGLTEQAESAEEKGQLALLSSPAAIGCAKLLAADAGVLRAAVAFGPALSLVMLRLGRRATLAIRRRQVS